jgi:hypothetical protein
LVGEGEADGALFISFAGDLMDLNPL